MCQTDGIADDRAVALLHGERESPLAAAREHIGGIATRIALAEAEVPPYDADMLDCAGKRFEELATHPAQLVAATARHYIPGL